MLYASPSHSYQVLKEVLSSWSTVGYSGRAVYSHPILSKLVTVLNASPSHSYQVPKEVPSS